MDLSLQDSRPFFVRVVLPNLPNPPGYGSEVVTLYDLDPTFDWAVAVVSSCGSQASSPGLSGIIARSEHCVYCQSYVFAFPLSFALSLAELKDLVL